MVVASRLARILARDQPDGVIMIGTAGSYPDGPRIGEACVARRVGLSHGVAVMGLGYVPRPPAPIPCDPRLLSRVNLDPVDVLTVGAITTDAVLAGRLGDGWQVEHLEAFGAAEACSQAQVPFLAVLGISNRVGPEAHTQWLAHRSEAQAAAREAIRHLVSASEGL